MNQKVFATTTRFFIIKHVLMQINFFVFLHPSRVSWDPDTDRRREGFPEFATQSSNLYTLKDPRNQFQGIDSARLGIDFWAP
jgi:hypothetical protein